MKEQDAGNQVAIVRPERRGRGDKHDERQEEDVDKVTTRSGVVCSETVASCC
ncbi:MAG: hypothetical protein ACXV49_10225 [Halobacteriota archaeon]